MWTWINHMAARIRALFRVSEEDRDFGMELETHLSMLTEEKIRAGLPPEEARRRARLELGGLAQLQQAHREVRGLPFVDGLMQDLRYALRALRREKGFAIFAVLILGVGVAGSSTVLGVVNAVLLRPLPFDASDRLIWISNIADNKVDEWRIQVGHFLDLREQTKSFTDLAGYNSFYTRGNQVLTGAGEPDRFTSVDVTQNFFPFLGVQPALGRNFTAEESQWNGPGAAMLSDRLWRLRFGSDPTIIGRSITLNDAPVTIVGVLPPSFNFVTVFDPGAQVDLYRPFPTSRETNRWGNVLVVLGRLRPGVSLENARAEFEVLGRQFTEQHSTDRNTLRPKLTPLAERINGRFRAALFILAWAVGAVMLIVCANLSNLQLARMAARKKEMAIRIALGAGRVRLIRQLLTEGLVLSFIGAAVGLLLSAIAIRALARLEAFSIPLLENIRIDALGFSVIVLIAAAIGIVLGLAPAFQTPTLAVYDDLKDGARAVAGGKKLKWVRGALVVSEIAVAYVLLLGTGLLAQSFLRVLEVDLGFRPDRAAAMRIDPNTRFPDQAARRAYYEDAIHRIRSTPGVEEAALADVLPLGGNRSWGVAGEGQVYPRDAMPQAFVRIVSDGYFQTMGVPLLAGRDFTAQDAASGERVVILNEMMARMLWPGQNPIGQKMTQDGGRRVVGIVGNVRHKALEDGYTGEMYLPIWQSGAYSSVDVIVKTSRSSGEMSAGVRNALRPIAPNLPLNEWRPLRQLVDKSVSPRRFVVLLLSGFSGFALLLAALGIFGVVSYSVNQRTREIGIRMALGASARMLQARVLFETLRLALVGILIGGAVSWGVSRGLKEQLFGMTETDPLTFFGIAVLLAIVAAAAGYLPARRSSQINPIEALRAE